MRYKDIVNTLTIIGKSKKIKRAGWVREKITDPESVADHSFRVIVLAMVLGDELRIDREKLIKMAIIHDIGETITGDIVVERGKVLNEKLRKEKEKREEEIVEKLLKIFGEEYNEIFHEMIQRETKESKIFWQLDKLEMAIQAKEYEIEQKKDLKEFFENADVHMKDPLLVKILEEIEK